MQAVAKKPESGLHMGMGSGGGAQSSSSSSSAAAAAAAAYELVRRQGARNAVVVFGRSRCCMCTVAKRLLFGLGVGPTVVDLDEHPYGDDIEAVLSQISGGGRQAVPAVFVGGKFLGGVETLMAWHINGTLIPLLKEAGALWL